MAHAPSPPSPPVRTTRASLVLRHVGFHSAADDDDPIVRLVSSFLTRVPTWLSALHRDVPEATSLWAVQWLVAHDVPEEDSYWMVGHCGFDYTPMDRAAKRGYLSVVQFLHEHSTHGCTEYAIKHATKKDHSEVLHFLYEERWELEKAARKFGYRNRTDQNQIDQIIRAVRSGELDELQRVHALVSPSLATEIESILVDHVEAVTENGYIDVAEWVHEHAPTARKCSQFGFHDAIKHNRKSFVRFALEHQYALDYTKAITYAAEEGKLEMLQLLCQHHPGNCTAEAFKNAAWYGHFEIVRFLCEHCDQVCTTDGIDYGAAAGSLEIVRYLHEYRTEGCTTIAVDAAAQCGHLPVVQFLVENRTEGGTTDAMDEAASNGHLEIVQYLHEHTSVGCTTDAMDDAASNGYLEVVQFLHSHRTEGCTTDAIDQAASNGHLDVVKFLHEHRTEGYTDAALADALSNGHFDVVRFLCELHTGQGSTGRLVATRYIQEKRLDVLVAFHDARLMELNSDDFLLALEYGQLEMIEFVYNQISFTDHEQRNVLERAAVETAAKRGDVSVLVWLDAKRLQGETLTSQAIKFASRAGHLEAAEYLAMHGHDGPMGGMMGLAAYRGRLDLVRYLHEHRMVRCTHHDIAMAVDGGHFDIVRYLYDHRDDPFDVEKHWLRSVTKTCIEQRRHHLLAYLYERELAELRADDFALAIKSSNQLEMLELLYDACIVAAPDKRKALGKAIEEAAKLRAQSVLEFIDVKRLNGEIFLPSKAMEYAATRGHLEIAENLITHNHDGCTGAVMNLAAFRGRLDVVQYLHETRGDGFSEKALQLAERKGHMDVVAYINEIRGHAAPSGERGAACLCRYCTVGPIEGDAPEELWGDGADY